MIRYRDKLPPELRVATARDPETAEAKAALNFVLAVDNGWELDPGTLATLRGAFIRVLAGERDVFKLASGRGNRPSDGFTPDDVVACWIERERRRLEPTHPTNALETAQTLVVYAFSRFFDHEEPSDAIRLCWKRRATFVEVLSDADLDHVLAPYQLPAPDIAATLGPSPSED